jgi:hypothetical protein
MKLLRSVPDGSSRARSRYFAGSSRRSHPALKCGRVFEGGWLGGLLGDYQESCIDFRTRWYTANSSNLSGGEGKYCASGDLGTDTEGIDSRESAGATMVVGFIIIGDGCTSLSGLAREDAVVGVINFKDKTGKG